MGEGILATASAAVGAAKPKGVVIIHGAGDWPQDYWKPIVQNLTQLIGTPMDTPFGAVAVNYSDVLNSPNTAPARAIAAVPRKNDYLNLILWDNIFASIALAAPEQLVQRITGSLASLGVLAGAAALKPSEAVMSMLATLFLGKSLDQLRTQIGSTIAAGGKSVADTIEDVCLYLYDNNFAQKLRQKLIDALHAAQQYDEIILLSHSLGTVVAFDVLNDWTEATPRISHWFTLGCPLPKVLRLRPGTFNQLKNPNVKYWYNVFDTTDPVGGALNTLFSKPGIAIHDIFVDIAKDPIGSHDYFDNPATLRMIADVIY